MPFTFKLSKRLALSHAMIAAGVLLAPACDSTHPTAPEAPSSPLMASVTSVPATSVLASGDDGNIPQNTLDKSLATRWSAYGDGQWIRYDLGAVMAIGLMDIAWYRGNEYIFAFDILTSPDAVTWTRVFSGRNSGQTLQAERYGFATVMARYVRIVGRGQWNGTTRLSLWNSITEVAISGTSASPSAASTALTVASVVASGDDGNVPRNVLDKDLGTRWSAYGDGQWIRYDLGALRAVDRLDIAWYRGNEGAFAFDLDVSSDAVIWTRVFRGRSSGLTLERERYDIPKVTARYVRITGHGYWSGATRLSLWNSITEFDISGPAPASPGTVTDLAVVGITDTAATLTFTEVNDGTGLPASYDVRVGAAPISWGRALPSVTRGTCATPVAGSAIGFLRTCTVRGLQPGTTYEFQLVAFRGTLDLDAAFGELSNVARAATVPPPPPPPPAPSDPGTVTDLAVASITDTAMTLSFTEVNDGTGLPASYDVRVGVAPISWGSALPTVTRGTCATPLGGSEIGTLRTCTVLGLQPGTSYEFQLVGFRGTMNLDATFGGLSNVAQAATAPTAPPPPPPPPAPSNPGTVTDLVVASVTDTAVTLSFTEVHDGTGQPASYNVRLGPAPITWGGLPSVTRGTCATPLAGSAVGAVRTCTVLGLQAGTTYEFQLVAFRGTLNLDAVFGGLSNIARAAIAPSTAPVALVSVSPSTSSVLVGATQQFSPVLKDASGAVLTGRPVTWTSDNPVVALVSSTGLVSALLLGSATITATSEGKSGTATLTVTSSSGGPSPTGTIIFQDGFESGHLGLWEQIPNTGRYSVSSDAARVKSGSHSLRALYSPTNTYGTITRWFMPGYDEVYVRFYVMFEETFVNPGMHFFVLSGNRIDNQSSSSGKASVVPNGTDFFYAGIDPEYNPQDPILRPFHYYTYWPDMGCCYGNRSYQLLPKTPLIGGQWHEVVFHIRLNTPGQYNGNQTMWVDGVKKIDVQNMRWRTTTDVRLNQIRFDNWMETSPRTQYIWVDNVTVWTP